MLLSGTTLDSAFRLGSSTAIAAFVCALAGLGCLVGGVSARFHRDQRAVWIWLAAPVFALTAVLLSRRARARAICKPEFRGAGWAARTGGALGITALILMLPTGYLMPQPKCEPVNARLVASCARLQTVGQLCREYAREADGAYPPDLSTLALISDHAQRALRVPASDEFPKEGGYYYVTGLAIDDPPEWILAFTDPVEFDRVGVLVLFVDGHVEFMQEPTFTEAIEAFKREFETNLGEPPTIIEPK